MEWLPVRVEQSKSVTVREESIPSDGQPESDTFADAVREANLSLHLCAKQIRQFVDVQAPGLRKVLIHEGFHHALSRTAGSDQTSWLPPDRGL